MKYRFAEEKKRKNGGIMAVYKIIRESFTIKTHSHDRENARRRRQIAKGMIQVTAPRQPFDPIAA